MIDPLFRISELSVTCGSHRLLDSVNLDIPAGGVFGLIGPSGAGKSTLLKSLNRLIELTPGLKLHGQVIYKGHAIYSSSVDGDELRARIGMLFQQPVVFPTSILGNVIFGVRHLRQVSCDELTLIAERSLRGACLWEEVKDRLRSPASRLSIGQQQRLCLARALACDPAVILMDEPTSALDPRSTESIENLIEQLSSKMTIVLVTHNIRQAERLCDKLASFNLGQLDAVGSPAQVLS